MTTRVDGINITDGVITEAKLQTKLNPDNAIDSNAFNIGVLGFKLAVNDGLTVFNLIDGVVDEFHDNTGVDTVKILMQFMMQLQISLKIKHHCS